MNARSFQMKNPKHLVTLTCLKIHLMLNLIIFGFLSVPIVILSWRTLLAPGSHGFYRFFGWECILWLFAFNSSMWFKDPFSFHQILSWLFLCLSAYLVISGVIRLHKSGKPNSNRNEKSLYQFEKTSVLVETGIFKYIRHPLYSSLIFLTWGILLKRPDVHLFLVSLISTAFLYLTARYDEKECIGFFGTEYLEYMKRSKMFIPFVI
jgi:protein-S-isoprenylcysteine O-methyltransferase Ste14